MKLTRKQRVFSLILSPLLLPLGIFLSSVRHFCYVMSKILGSIGTGLDRLDRNLCRRYENFLKNLSSTGGRLDK